MTYEPDYTTLPLNTVEFPLPVLRRREDPIEAMHKIADDIGARPVTSIAEAQTAAYVASRLRRSGLQVWTDPFRTHALSGSGTLMLALLGSAAIGMWSYDRLYALAIAATTCVVAIVLTNTLSRYFRRATSESQNVVATHAPIGPATRRVVLLVPLDTHQPRDPIGSREAQVAATLALLMMMALEYIAPMPLPVPVRTMLLIVPALYLLLAASAELWVRSQPYSAGAVSYASSIAAMLAAVDDVGRLNHTELWAVGLGGGTTGAGLAHLVKKYPFDANATFFIGLEGIGRGTLSYLIHDVNERTRSADDMLVDVFTEATLGVRAEPRIANFVPLVRPLTQAKRRAISVACLDHNGRVPLQGSSKDTSDAITPAIVEQSARLIANAIRGLDAHSG
jgi:hypothetical protein